MVWQLTFTSCEEYDPGQPGISLPVTLRLGGLSAVPGNA